MNFEKYKNPLEYPKKLNLSAYTADLRKYKDKEREMYELFKRDALVDVGYLDSPIADVLFNKAWEYGHSFGYSEVYNHLLDLSDFVNDILKVIEVSK